MALTRITQNSPGVHLSSPPKDHAGHLSSPLAPGIAEGDLLDIELMMAEDNFFKKLSPSPPLSPLLDSCLLDALLEFPDNGDLSQFQYQMSPFDQGKLALLSSPCCSLNILSTHKSLRDAQQLALDMQPDTLGTFIISVHDAGDRQESSSRPWALLAENTGVLHCSQQLPGLTEQQTLDSEATASSSSSSDDGDDPEVDRNQQHNGARWLRERAEIGSRWSWLQLRVDELEGRIGHATVLHKHLRSTKVGMVLGDSQLLTEPQQMLPCLFQSLLEETWGLSCAARDRGEGRELPRDGHYEPSSPLRLLHYMKRQSTQLCQILTSMSPLSKPPQTWMGGTERACCSARVAGSQRRQRDCRWWGPRAGCARAQPLRLPYHKPGLFTTEEPGARTLQSTNPSTSREPVAWRAEPTRRSKTSTGGSLTCATSCSQLPPEPVSTVYDINDVILPMSLAASANVELKQYKHILNPSWRMVTMQSSPVTPRGDEEEVGEEEQVEDMRDEAFRQRHLEPEQREKLLLSWPCCRHRNTRPSRGEGLWSREERAELAMEASFALLETDEHSGPEETLMVTAGANFPFDLLRLSGSRSGWKQDEKRQQQQKVTCNHVALAVR
ncbi:hypothetical protein CRUP_038181 [Coryphaenoides rupestris]|nr:hypothetical protein CRUP_038181 [Coryphaenoides rupestris]